jgi:crotonobetainyl-CoA:carnitine CoA-transferase CaiB-like acyl-CoA transferase
MKARGEHAAEVDEIVTAWTATLSKLDAMRALGAAGVPAGALRSTTEVPSSAERPSAPVPGPRHPSSRGGSTDTDGLR